jgi:hypothetical protein
MCQSRSIQGQNPHSKLAWASERAGSDQRIAGSLLVALTSSTHIPVIAGIASD